MVRYGNAIDVGIDGVLELRILSYIVWFCLACGLRAIDLAQSAAEIFGRILRSLVNGTPK
jgi:hypothetical protein